MSTDNTRSVGETWLAMQPDLSMVEEAWELQGTGPGGTDIVLYYRADRRGIQNVIVQGFTTLPAERKGFATRTLAYMSHGGVVIRDPLATIAFYCNVSLV